MDNLSYEAAGVNIDAANEMKKQLSGSVSARGFAHCRPLNGVGAFASLVELNLAEYKNPVFVLKSEEPGSKQMLSIDNDRIEWIARDLINHLVNDIIVAGAQPCAVIDTIICGKMESDRVLRLINEMSAACEENGCILVGGETSEQPGVLPEGRYVLQAGILGVVDREKVIDGAALREGDALLALASNGLHTNGYSLVRKIMETKPEILGEKIGGEGFLDCILKPHTSYAGVVKRIVGERFGDVHAMAHITGGGIHDNFLRVLQPDGLRAEIDLSVVRAPRVFGLIREYANAGDDDMLRTFNCGVGMIIAVGAEAAGEVMRIAAENSGGMEVYEIGRIIKGERAVTFRNSIKWNG
jgi:phosphoribosylformylglycinamidine cyclo-ligase